MKRYVLLMFVVFGLLLFLFSCSESDNNADYANGNGYTDVGENTDAGKYFSLSDTPSSNFYMRTEYSEYDMDVEKIRVFFDRKDRNGFEYDYRYLVYVYENNEWKKIPFKEHFIYRPGKPELVREDPNATDLTEMSHTISISDLNFKLKPGLYRVQKEFEDGSVYAEFTIK